MRQILDRGAKFTAVLASNDNSALGAMDELQAAGLVVPRDVAVIGFDDRSEAKAQAPTLTTVHFPMFELGYQAAGLLLKAIEGQMKKGELVRIPTRLVIRESCGCLPGAFDRAEGAVTMRPVTLGRSGYQSPADSSDFDRETEEEHTRQVYQQLSEGIITAVHNESHGLTRQEVADLAQRLSNAF